MSTAAPRMMEITYLFMTGPTGLVLANSMATAAVVQSECGSMPRPRGRRRRRHWFTNGSAGARHKLAHAPCGMISSSCDKHRSDGSDTQSLEFLPCYGTSAVAHLWRAAPPLSGCCGADPGAPGRAGGTWRSDCQRSGTRSSEPTAQAHLAAPGRRSRALNP
jgi:hypothetical protein